MQLQDSELPQEYKDYAAKLAEMIEFRERVTRDVHLLPLDLRKQANEQLRQMDATILDIEAGLAAEYERLVQEKAKEAELARKIDEGWLALQEIYILIKHTTPHLLESFTKEVLDPMPDENREELLDAIAVLEATQLKAILSGEYQSN